MKKQIKQHDVTDCGAACLVSVAAHYRLGIPIARVRQLAGTDQRGTNLLGLLQAAQKLEFEARGVRAEVASLPKAPLPAIAHIITPKKLHHFVVLYKATKRGYQIMDPAVGRKVRWSKQQFEEQWTGVLLLLQPSAAFRSGNRRISVLRRFWALLQPHRSTLVQALVGAVAYTILGLSTSIYLQKITDHVLLDGNTNLLNLLSLVMLAILLFSICISSLKSIMVLRSGQLIDAQLILGYYRHLLRLPQSFFDRMRVGEIVSRIGDAVKIRAFVNNAGIELLVNALIVLFSFGLMFTYYWKLGLVMLGILPLYALIYAITNALNRRRERALMEHAAEVEAQIVESLTAVRTIKQLGMEKVVEMQTEARFVDLLKTSYRSGLTYIFSANASEFTSRLFTILLLWLGAYMVLQRHITPGELLSFYAIVGYFTGPARSLIGMNKTIQNALIAADRLFEVIDLEREPTTDRFELTSRHLGDIQFRKVHFAYGPREPVLQGLDLTIRLGTVTALVGESGSGKSTIAALLQQLYRPAEGQLSIGSHNLCHIDPTSLRRLISVVPQHIDLFSGTLLSNIAPGETTPEVERILQLCQSVGILTFIEQLPLGLQSPVGEQGLNLSGGQRQRLALVRALYRQPEILLLDEATSALDSVAESYVQTVIQDLRQRGKTVILIAHRLSTIVAADRIVVLHAGQVAEQGTHAELLEQCGRYHALWERQFPPHVRRILAA